MAGFIVFKKLPLEEAIKNMIAIEQWFKNNPNKKTCTTDLFKVRRGFVATDIAEHSEFNKD